ncbi:hypothetical protein GQ53DRAFT_819495 [Thozetella sp. PMI_491]|nr:hypothetical protein GQ53DRAFT_819495 [Thozetella sp. PMI_491]
MSFPARSGLLYFILILVLLSIWGSKTIGVVQFSDGADSRIGSQIPQNIPQSPEGQHGGPSALHAGVEGGTETSENISPANPSDGVDIKKDNSFEFLSDLCRQTDWIPGLWLHCHTYSGYEKTYMRGGLNNARNRIQACLRLAIDAGAGLIIPPMTTRNPEKLYDTTNPEGAMCPDVWFDIDYLHSSLNAHCPKLQIQACKTHVDNETRVLTEETRLFPPNDFYVGQFRKFVNTTVASNNVSLDAITPERPVVIEFGDSFCAWAYHLSDELRTIRKSLFHTLKFNRTVLALGDRVLQSPLLKDKAFIGVHLRGEDDWPILFGSLWDQLKKYTEEIRAINEPATTTAKSISRVKRIPVPQPAIKTIFANCGDPTVIQKLRDILEPLGYVVHDKWTILREGGWHSELAELDDLDFDSKAILDYRVQSSARYFMGSSLSTLSLLIAYERTMDDDVDVFERYLFVGSTIHGHSRDYGKNNLELRGSATTKLMLVPGGDYMRYFP